MNKFELKVNIDAFYLEPQAESPSNLHPSNILRIPCLTLDDARKLVKDLKETLDLRVYLGNMESPGRALFSWYSDSENRLFDIWGYR